IIWLLGVCLLAWRDVLETCGPDLHETKQRFHGGLLRITDRRPSLEDTHCETDVLRAGCTLTSLSRVSRPASTWVGRPCPATLMETCLRGRLWTHRAAPRQQGHWGGASAGAARQAAASSPEPKG